MSWIIGSRDVGLLALLALVSLALCGMSLALLRQARERERTAVLVITQADSLMRDWIGRGCAPRTKAVP